MTRIEGRSAIDEQFAQIMRERDVRTVFQPVVHLPSHAVVGYEALVRGPAGSPLASAEALLAAANRAGRLAELDWVTRASACRAALDADLDVDHVLFLNLEPIALDSDCPPDLWPTIEQGFHRLRVVLEVTERSLDRDPGTLLDGIERQRPLVAGIGLDDVGSHPATLAMLPLVAPNVIKIDRSIVQATPDERVARVISAIHAEAERTDAIILAEGVEHPEHRHRAMAQAAQFGQGQLFGGPGSLPSHPERPRHRAPIHRLAPMFVASPFDALSGQVDGMADDDLLLALNRNLASYAEASRPSLYISLLPGPDELGGTALAQLAQLASAGTFAAVVGRGLPAEPGQGVRGVGQRREPVPRDEWAAVTVGPYLSAAVLARREPGENNQWMYGVTHDPSQVIAAARSLVRLLGTPEPRFQFES